MEFFKPLYMIDTMDITPRFDWIPFWMPQTVELFCKYLITFSLAMGLLNAVPCYGLDGQFMCRIVVDYFFVRLSPAYAIFCLFEAQKIYFNHFSRRQKIANAILYFGTVVFTLNLAIGFLKFLVNYSR